MDPSVLLVAFSSAVVLTVSVVLVFHPEYEDGLFGRIALALLSVASYIRLMDLVATDFTRRPFGTVAVVLWFGLALFMARHLCRFLRWKKRTGHEHERNWRAARK